MLYVPAPGDPDVYLCSRIVREFMEKTEDALWFDHVARFDHGQLRPMRRRGVFF